MDAVDGSTSLPNGGMLLPEIADLGSFRGASDQIWPLSRKYREDHALELLWGLFSSSGR